MREKNIIQKLPLWLIISVQIVLCQDIQADSAVKTACVVSCNKSKIADNKQTEITAGDLVTHLNQYIQGVTIAFNNFFFNYKQAPFDVRFNGVKSILDAMKGDLTQLGSLKDPIATDLNTIFTNIYRHLRSIVNTIESHSPEKRTKPVSSIAMPFGLVLKNKKNKLKDATEKAIPQLKKISLQATDQCVKEQLELAITHLTNLVETKSNASAADIIKMLHGCLQA